MFDKVFKRRQSGRHCPDGQCTRKHRRRLIPGSYIHDLPVPIKIDPYKQKKHRRVHIGKAVVYSEPQQKQPKKLLLIKKKKESYDDSEKGCFGLKRWYAKRKALNEFKAENKRKAKQAEEWRKWKYEEAARADRAENEKARLEREAEYVRQVHEIEKQERKLAKNTLKTRYPHPTATRKIPKESFNKNELPAEPYYPKRIENDANDEFEAQKRERKKTKKELKTNNYVPFDDTPPATKSSKFKSYMNKIKKEDKQKEVPYTDPYNNLYDKPYGSTKAKSYTNVYHTYKQHEDPCSDKCKRDQLSAVSAAELYKRYYELPSGRKKKKGTKTKKQKIKKTDLEKRKSCTFAHKFVNCFYRTCCECFCWLSIFLVIGFVIIMVA